VATGSDEARPGIVYVNGTEKVPRGQGHRDDGPAAIYPGGRVWFVEGEKPREERSASQPSLVKAI
jgi:hypothetical protein